MTDYRTPDGYRAIFCTGLFVQIRQHLTLEGLLPTATACGHPVGDWSTAEMRTLIGVTCRTCVRNVTKHGKTRPTLIARVMIKFAPELIYLYSLLHPPKPNPEPISTDELFPEHKTPRRKARPTEEDED
jgi:hypothetical protein